MRRFALVFAGGFCGTLARYLLAAPLLALAAALWPGRRGGFPFDILLINLTGALAMGLLYGLFERGVALSADARLLLGTGFLGAYTTFSSLAYGGDQLLLRGASTVALVYFVASMALGVACAHLGVSLAGIISNRRRLVRLARARVRATRRALRPTRTLARTNPRLDTHGHPHPHTLHAPGHHPSPQAHRGYQSGTHAHPAGYEPLAGAARREEEA